MAFSGFFDHLCDKLPPECTKLSMAIDRVSRSWLAGRRQVVCVLRLEHEKMHQQVASFLCVIHIWVLHYSAFLCQGSLCFAPKYDIHLRCDCCWEWERTCQESVTRLVWNIAAKYELRLRSFSDQRHTDVPQQRNTVLLGSSDDTQKLLMVRCTIYSPFSLYSKR